jgi:hypothetical protein
MPTVNISGTWSEKQRPNNGLERVADLIHGNRIIRVPVVGYIEYHQWTEKLTGDVLTVAIPVVEATLADDGSDPLGRGKQTLELIDELRKERGVGSVDDVPTHSGELANQMPFDFDGPEGDERGEPETRLGPDGEHVVPPPSAEEVAAEVAEAKAAKGKKPATDPFTTGGAA